MIASPLKAAGLLGAAGCLLVACIQPESFFPGFPPVGADSAPASRYARARIEVYEVRLNPSQSAGFDAAKLTDRAKTLSEFETALRELGTARRMAQVDQPVDQRKAFQLSLGSTVPAVIQGQTTDGQASTQARYQDLGCTVEWKAQMKGLASAEQPFVLEMEVGGMSTGSVQLSTGDGFPSSPSARLPDGLPIVLTSIAADRKSGEPIGYAARVQFVPQIAGGVSLAPPAEPSPQAYQTQVLIDVFKVALDPASAPILSADSLQDAAKDAEKLRDHLSKLGTTELLFRGGQPVTLESRTVIRIGASCPIIVGKMKTTAKGQSGATIQYEDCGCIVELEGQWDYEDPTRGEAVVGMEVSSVDRSRMKLADDLTAPIFRILQSHAAGPISTSKPMLMVATDAASADEPAAAYVARIEFRRTPIAMTAVKSDADRAAGCGLADADISVFEVALKPNQEAMLTYDSLAGHAESNEGLQEFLNDHGAVRLLSRFTQRVDLEKGEKLERMDEKQLPESSGRNKDGQWGTTYRQHKVGTKIDFLPHGDRSAQGTADVTMKLKASDMRDSQVKIGPDAPAPLFLSLDHQFTAPLIAGRPLVFLTVNGTGGEGMAYAQVVRMFFHPREDGARAMP